MSFQRGTAYFAQPVLESLLTDIVTGWRRKQLGAGLVLEVSGCAPLAIQLDATPTVKIRGTVGVSFDGPAMPPPRWQ